MEEETKQEEAGKEALVVEDVEVEVEADVVEAVVVVVVAVKDEEEKEAVWWWWMQRRRRRRRMLR